VLGFGSDLDLVLK